MKLLNVRFLLVALLFVSTIGAIAIPTSRVLAASCVTTNVDAYDLGTGTWYDPDYVVDVYDVSNTSGAFLYWNPLNSSWESVYFSPWYSINGGAGVRWGVDTTWTWSHPYWAATSWRYVYPC